MSEIHSEERSVAIYEACEALAFMGIRPTDALIPGSIRNFFYDCVESVIEFGPSSAHNISVDGKHGPTITTNLPKQEGA